MLHREPALDEPVIVLTSARSGSTLVRLILDAHPDLACPPETNVVKTCWQFVSAFNVTNGPVDGEGVPAGARAGVHAMISALFRDYLTRHHKVRWCDKSLGTAAMAAWFAELYPKAKFICLYRHCMDVMYSGLEASPWGLTGYGFDQFTAPGGNSLSALAAYWIEHTGQIAGFERAHGERCVRVHYERLVESPEEVAGELFAFLGVEPVPGITSRCLAPDAEVIGPGDHKIMATRKITADSVGRGVRIPPEVIPGPQLKVINYLLAGLGYTEVDEAWRRSPCPPAPLGGDNGSRGQAQEDVSPVSLGDHFARTGVEKINNVFRARIEAGFLRSLPSAGLAGSDGCTTFELVAYHDAGRLTSRSCHVDLASRSVTLRSGVENGRPAAGWLISGDIETWLAVLAGRSNMAACFRSGLLRYIGPGEEEEETDAATDAVPRQAVRIEKRLAVVRELLGLVGYPEEVSD